jgi:apolipoprotein N-acyltransferase
MKENQKEFFTCLFLTALASLLFVASFPNLLVENGVSFLAWLAYIPVFIVIGRLGLAASFFWGALYGYTAYTLFNYWLAAFHPLANLTVGLFYMVFMAALFFLLKLAWLLFPRRAYLVQWALWLAYEYLRTLGFLGYPYGITGYSQWRQLPLIQIAGVFGVWGVSALLVFPSAWLAAALEGWRLSSGAKGLARALLSFFRREKPALLFWAASLCAALVFGFASLKSYDDFPKARLALIQHNTDPWRGDIYQYRKNFEILRRLSDEALAAEPKPDMVVWSETAFVPRIYWYETYRDDPSSWVLVKELLDYLAGKEVPFLIGNDDARKEPAKNPNHGENYRVDYNAALLFEKGKITQFYRKMRLVPFTEYFPYKKQFPRLYKALLNAETHFFYYCEQAVVFSGPGFSFSCPICFEDCFGYLSRDFARRGADIIVNMSNDAWSASLPAQNQHLSMAVFRAVENRRALARSTASGQTCAIDPSGRIIDMASPFKEAWITVEIPVVKGNTVYSVYGDYLAQGFTIAAFFLLMLGGILYIIKKKGKGYEHP